MDIKSKTVTLGLFLRAIVYRRSIGCSVIRLLYAIQITILIILQKSRVRTIAIQNRGEEHSLSFCCPLTYPGPHHAFKKSVPAIWDRKHYTANAAAHGRPAAAVPGSGKAAARAARPWGQDCFPGSSARSTRREGVAPAPRAWQPAPPHLRRAGRSRRCPQEGGAGADPRGRDPRGHKVATLPAALAVSVPPRRYSANGPTRPLAGWQYGAVRPAQRRQHSPTASRQENKNNCMTTRDTATICNAARQLSRSCYKARASPATAHAPRSGRRCPSPRRHQRACAGRSAYSSSPPPRAASPVYMRSASPRQVP